MPTWSGFGYQSSASVTSFGAGASLEPGAEAEPPQPAASAATTRTARTARVRIAASLRWHDPDQVRGSALIAPSQPRTGLPGKRLPHELTPARPRRDGAAAPRPRPRRAASASTASSTTAAPTSGGVVLVGGLADGEPEARTSRRTRRRALPPPCRRRRCAARRRSTGSAAGNSTRRKIAAGVACRVQHHAPVLGVDRLEPVDRADRDREEAHQRDDHELRREPEAEVDHEQRRERDQRHALAWRSSSG